MKKIDPVLHERLQTLIGGMGYELVGCELRPQGRRALFRIYIDKKGGVTLDDCSRVSRQVSAMMDVEDPIVGGYVLEVSSPGVDRPLFVIEHFKQYVGSVIKIRLDQPINQRRQYQGILKRVEGENIYLWLEDKQQEIKLSFSSIERANVVGDIHF